MSVSLATLVVFISQILKYHHCPVFGWSCLAENCIFKQIMCMLIPYMWYLPFSKKPHYVHLLWLWKIFSTKIYYHACSRAFKHKINPFFLRDFLAGWDKLYLLPKDIKNKLQFLPLFHKFRICPLRLNMGSVTSQLYILWQHIFWMPQKSKIVLTEVRKKWSFSRFMKMYAWVKFKFGVFLLNRKTFLQNCRSIYKKIFFII